MHDMIISVQAHRCHAKLWLLQLCETSLDCANPAGPVTSGAASKLRDLRAQVVYSHTVSSNRADGMWIFQRLHAAIAEGLAALALRTAAQWVPAGSANTDVQWTQT
jgi:hypothetical protein